ncbi:MAG: hypothetical protein JW969_10775, partial [Spirochaetales bacterium]|nr:hypothetical protein [Spirochaetales bacterium]
MIRIRKLLIPIIIILFIIPVSLSGLEIGVGYRMGNLLFKQDRDISDTSFTGEDVMNWGLSVNINQKITDNVLIESAFISDTILRNISYLLFSYSDSMF